MRTRVKICGITTVEDASLAIRHGADALGLVFYAKSPRAVSIEQAREIADNVPAFVSIVGLFVDAESEEITRVLGQVNIDLLQFHGSESPSQCGRFGKRYIKAISMRDNIDLFDICNQYQQASAILVDSYKPGIPGGTGEVFEWDRIPSDLNQPLILAGGLNAKNVGEAISAVHPFAVDVSSGVEREKGLKDESKIVSFMRGVESVKSE